MTTPIDSVSGHCSKPSKHGGSSRSRASSFPVKLWAYFAIFMISITSMASAVASDFSQIATRDTNMNGKLDQIEISFSGPVTIVDNDLNGLGLFDIPGFKIVEANYSGTSLSMLTLNVEEDHRFNTGATPTVTYRVDAGLGAVTVDGTGVEIVDGDGMMSMDGASPTLVEVFYTNPDAGEATLKFSEPVQRATGSILTISDFSYNDFNVGGASSVSAMGADADGSDGTVTVLLNAALTTADTTPGSEDGIIAIGLTDANSNMVNSAGAPLIQKLGSGGLVEVQASPLGPVSVGMAFQAMMNVHIFAIEGNVMLERLSFDVSGVSSAELTQARLVAPDGAVLSSVISPVPGGFDISLTNPMDVTSGGLDVIFEGVLELSPSTGTNDFMLTTMPQNYGMANAVPNGGSQPSIAHTINVISGTTGGGDLYAQIYGEAPSDAGIDRIVLEPNHIDNHGFLFYSELVGPKVMDVVSATLTAPNGRVVTYNLPEPGKYHMDLEAGPLTGGNFFASTADLNADFGAGDYTITVNYQDATSDVWIINANPVLSNDVMDMTIAAPTAGATVDPNQPVGFTWSFAGSANLFDLDFETPDGAQFQDEASRHVLGNVFSESLAKDNAVPFLAGTDYIASVSAMTVDALFPVTSSNGDVVTVSVQQWETSDVTVSTSGTMVTPALSFKGEALIEYFRATNRVGVNFLAEVEVMGDVSTVTMQAPDNQVYNMSPYFSYQGGAEFEFETIPGNFADVSSLRSSFGSGNYVFTATATDGATATLTINVPVQDPVFGTAPLLEMDPTQPLTNTPALGYSVESTTDKAELIFEQKNVPVWTEFVFPLDPLAASFAVPFDQPLPDGEYDLLLAEINPLASPATVADSQGSSVSVKIQQFDAAIMLVTVGNGGTTDPGFDPTLPGAVLVEDDPNFNPNPEMEGGVVGAPVLKFGITTDAGTVNLNKIVIDVMSDAQDISADISSAKLVLNKENTAPYEVTGVLGSSNIVFDVPDYAPLSAFDRVHGDVYVDTTSFPTQGPLSFKLPGHGVRTNLGPGSSEFPVERFFHVGSTAVGAAKFINGASFEVGPEIHPMSSNTNVTGIFTFFAGPNQTGFDEARIDVPYSFSNLRTVTISASSSNVNLSGFSPLVEGSDYTLNVDPQMNAITVAFTTRQTANANLGPFFKIDFEADTIDEERSFELFHLYLINRDEGEKFAEARRNVNLELMNHPEDASAAQVRFTGTVSESRNVAHVTAEIDTVPSLLASTETPGVDPNATAAFKAFVKVEVLPGELGFDIVSLGFPDVMTFDVAQTTMSIWDEAVQSYVDAGAVATTKLGQLKFKLPTARLEGMHFVQINTIAQTGAIFDFINFEVVANNSTNPVAPFRAQPGNAERVEFAAEESQWNDLGMPVKIDSNLPSGVALAKLEGELEAGAKAHVSAGQDTEVTFLLKTTLSDEFVTGVGYDMLELELPMGFSLKGSVTVSTNGLSLLSSSEVTVETLAADPSLGNPAMARLKFSSTQTSSGNVYINTTLTAPISEVEGYAFVRALNRGYLHSDVWAVSADVDGDSIGGQLSLRVVAEQGTEPNLAGFKYELDVVSTGDARGADEGFVATDLTPVWRLHIAPKFEANSQGFDMIRVNLPYELAEDLPSSFKVFKSTADAVATSASWTLLSSGVDYDVKDLDSWSFVVKLRAVETAADVRYIVTFGKKVTPYPSFMFVDAVLNNSTNFGEVYGIVGEADGLVDDRNDGGFHVEGSFSSAPNAGFVGAQLRTSGEVTTGGVANFSIYTRIQIGPDDQGVDQFKFYYPHDLDGLRIVSAASATPDEIAAATNIFDAFVGKDIPSNQFSSSSVNPGELEVDLSTKVSVTKVVRFDLQANTPTYPIFAFIDMEVNNSKNYNPTPVAPLNVTNPNGSDLDASLGFEVVPNYTYESLKPIAVEGAIELLVTPEVDSTGVAQPFITPMSLPQFSVVFKAKFDSSVAGFDVIGMIAPSGFALPQTYTVYKSGTLAGLSDVANRLAGTDVSVNKNELANGMVKIEFVNTVQNATAASGAGYTDGTAYYRIDFQPTAPDFEVFGELDVFLTNKANPQEFWPPWANVATAADLGLTGTVFDNDAMFVDVLAPYIANAKPVVEAVVAEVNVDSGSGIYKGVIDMQTEGTFKVDVQPIILDANAVSGFDRIGIEIPFGFSAPTSVSVTKKVLDPASGTFAFAGNVRVESEFKPDLSRLVLRLKAVEKETDVHYYSVSFKSKTFDFPAPTFFGVVLDNSTAPNPSFAFAENVDGMPNNDRMEIDVLQKAFDTSALDDTAKDAFFDQYFTPVADALIVEVAENTASISQLAKSFSVYVKADNIEGQRGFNRLILELPWDFGNVANVKVFRSSDDVTYTQMAVGLGLSEVKALADDPTYGNMIRVDFSALRAVGQDEIIRLEFTADMPDYATAGEFFALVDDKSQSLPTFAFPGNASALSATDESLVFVEPDLSNVQFDKFPLSSFVSEVVAGNAIVAGSVVGAAQTAQSSYLDVFFSVVKGSNDLGFDFLEIFMPYPIEGNKLTPSDVKVAAVTRAGYVDQSSFVRVDPTKLKINKTDFSLNVKFAPDAITLNNDEETLFRVRIPVLAPDFSGLYFTGLRAFSTQNPGLDSYPIPGEVVADAGEGMMDVNVRPFISADFDATKFPVEFVEAESFPNFAPTNTSTRFVVASKINVTSNDSGYNQFKVDLPPGFGKPGSVSIEVSALSTRQLEPSQYTVNATPEALIVTLLDQTVVADGSIHYTTLAFDSVTPPSPDFGFFDFQVGNAANPFLAVPAAWSDVNPSKGDGSMAVDIFPDFNTITFIPPVDSLVGEVDAVPFVATPENVVLAGDSTKVSIYLNATGDAVATGGFDIVKLYVDHAFGTFPSKVKVEVTEAGVAAATTLLPGTSTGYDLDTSNPQAPFIKLKKLYRNVTMKISFDIQAPEDAGEYFVDFAVDNRAVPLDFYPQFGVVDLDGDDLDGNSIFVQVHPQPVIIDSTTYVVDSVVAEVNNAVAGADLKVNAGAKLNLDIKVTNTSGNGFNRLGFLKSEFLTFASLNTLSANANGVLTTLIKDVDFSVTPEDNRVRIRFNEVQMAGVSGEVVYRVNMSVNAPDFPTELRFDVALDNSNVRQPVFAFDGDANGALDSDNLFVDVIPDFSSFLSGGTLVLDKENILDLVSEVVFASGDLKKAEASSSNTLRVFIKPEFLANDRGVDKFRVQLPRAFGKPSNVVVYADNAGVRTKLDKGNVDYKATVGADNSVTIDFSGSQKGTYKLLDLATTNNNLMFVVEMNVLLPEVPNLYFVEVEADNKSFPFPKQSIFGDLNGNSDDDGDGLAFALNDNNNFVLVVPQKVSAADFAARLTAESVVAEIVGNANGELGKTVPLKIATKIVVGAGGNVNRFGLSLPPEFSNVNSFGIVKRSLATGTNTTLAEITDYTVDASDVSSIKVQLKKAIVEDVVLITTFNVTLPSRSADFAFGVAVDNSKAPKRFDGVEGDAISGVGTDSLFYFVDPAAFTAEDLKKSMISGLSASVVSPASVVVNKSTKVSMNIDAQFAAGDQGFDLLEVISTGMTGFKDVKILATPEGAAQYQLFAGQDYKVYETDTGATVAFGTAFSSNVSLSMSFLATAGKDPILAVYEVIAASRQLPLVVPAAVPSNGTLDISVTPAPKTAAELAVKPAKPVSSLVYDVTPSVVQAGNVLDLSVLVRATGNVESTQNGEIVPANSGFDLITVNLPKSFGQAGKVKLFHLVAGVETELQPFSDYSVTVSKSNKVSISLLTPLMATANGKVTGFSAVDFRVAMSVPAPKLPQIKRVRVAVNNSAQPLVVKAAKSDLSGDGVANNRIVVEPAPVNTSISTRSVAAAALGSVVYAQGANGDILGTVSEKAFVYTLRLQMNTTPDTVGFDSMHIALPKKFKKVAVKSVSVVNAGIVSAVPKGSKGYVPNFDNATKTLALDFGFVQGVEGSGNTFDYMDIQVVAKMPPKVGSYVHHVALYNSKFGATINVDPGQIATAPAVGQTGKLSVDVNLQQAAAKAGYYGNKTLSYVDGLKADLTAWDETNGSFSANIFQSTSARNILLQTEPVIADGAKGFDYLNIELPYGSGTPTNIVVFMRTAKDAATNSANTVYLQEFIDFQTTVTNSEISIEFTKAVDAAYMNSGAFSVVAPGMVAKELLVSFDMTMPNTLGQHLFDAYVLNTNVPTQSPYYVDPVEGEARSTTLSEVSRGVDGVGNALDGTRYLRINQISADVAAPVVTAATAAIVPVGNSSFLPKNAKRRLRLDVAVAATATDSYDFFEIQLPEGFRAVTNMTVDEGLTTLREYVDYNLDHEHPRSVGVSLKKARQGDGSFTFTFDVVSPIELPRPDLGKGTYVFGVAISKMSAGLLKTKPVYAQAGKASSLNSSALLSTLVQDGAVVSGTIVLGELPLGPVSATVTLTGASSTYAKSILFDLGVGSASFDFSLSTADDATPGIDPGDYTLMVEIPGFQSFSTPVSIVNSQTSLEGLALQIQPEPLQAAVALSPRYLEANVPTEALIYFDLNVRGASVQGFEFSFTPDLGIEVLSVSADNLLDSLTAIKGDTGMWTIDTSAVSVSSNVVVKANITAAEGVYDVMATAITASGNRLPIMGQADLTKPASFNVGSFLTISTTELPNAIIGDQYSVALASDFASAKVDAATVGFTAQILNSAGSDVSAQLGLAMTTSGVLGGTPLLIDPAGFVVKVTMTGNALSDPAVVYTKTVDLPLVVSRDAFILYSVTPAVIPATGGEFIAKGRGFTSSAVVELDGSAAASVTLVDSETLRVSTGALPVGSVNIVLRDSGEVVSLPNAVSEQSLLVAAAATMTQTFEASIEGEADLSDYEIVGLQGFYQGDIRAALEAAFGAYDTTKWRAYYYDAKVGHVQLNNLSGDSAFSKIRPGTAFWRISRDSGVVETQGVLAQEAPETHITIPAGGWALVSNVYGQKVYWGDVRFTTSANSSRVDMSVRDTGAGEFVNPNLYGFSKELAKSEENARSPYLASDYLEAGEGYWVQNKWVKAITLRVPRPVATGVQSKATSTKPALSFKAGEDLPPQPPQTFEKASLPSTSAGAAAGGGGGGGCLLK